MLCVTYRVRKSESISHFHIWTLDDVKRISSELPFHTCSKQQELVHTKIDPFGLGEGWRLDRTCRSRIMTVFALISIPRVFGHVLSAISIKEEKAIYRQAEKSMKQRHLCNVINLATRSLWILQTITCSIHTCAQWDLGQGDVWANWYSFSGWCPEYFRMAVHVWKRLSTIGLGLLMWFVDNKKNTIAPTLSYNFEVKFSFCPYLGLSCCKWDEYHSSCSSAAEFMAELKHHMSDLFQWLVTQSTDVCVTKAIFWQAIINYQQR